MKTELFVTLDWLEEKCCPLDCDLFVELFPEGEYSTAVLTKLTELGETTFAKWLVEVLPFNPVDLVINRLDDHLFYNGNVIIDNDVTTVNDISVKGDLTVNGKFIHTGSHTRIEAKNLNATEVYLYGVTLAVSNINVDKTVKVCDGANLYASTLKANILAVFDAKCVVNIKSIEVDLAYLLQGLINGDLITNTLATESCCVVQGKIQAQILMGGAANWDKFLPKIEKYSK